MSSNDFTNPGASEPANPAFEALCALPEFCRLEKRSPTLNGAIPLRAAQHCSPLFEGNAAGFQICLEQPMTIRRGARGVELNMTAPAYKATQKEEVRGAVENLVRGEPVECGA